MARTRRTARDGDPRDPGVDASLGGEPGEVRRVRGGRAEGGRDRARLPDLPVGLQEVEVVARDRAGDPPQDRDEEGPAEQDAEDEVEQRPPVHLPVEVPPQPAKAAGLFQENSNRVVPVRVNRSNRGRYRSARGPMYAVSSSAASGDDEGT